MPDFSPSEMRFSVELLPMSSLKSVASYRMDLGLSVSESFEWRKRRQTATNGYIAGNDIVRRRPKTTHAQMCVCVFACLKIKS